MTVTTLALLLVFQSEPEISVPTVVTDALQVQGSIVRQALGHSNYDSLYSIEGLSFQSGGSEGRLTILREGQKLGVATDQGSSLTTPFDPAMRFTNPIFGHPYAETSRIYKDSPNLLDAHIVGAVREVTLQRLPSIPDDEWVLSVQRQETLGVPSQITYMLVRYVSESPTCDYVMVRADQSGAIAHFQIGSNLKSSGQRKPFVIGYEEAMRIAFPQGEPHNLTVSPLHGVPSIIRGNQTVQEHLRSEIERGDAYPFYQVVQRGTPTAIRWVDGVRGTVLASREVTSRVTPPSGEISMDQASINGIGRVQLIEAEIPSNVDLQSQVVVDVPPTKIEARSDVQRRWIQIAWPGRVKTYRVVKMPTVSR